MLNNHRRIYCRENAAAFLQKGNIINLYPLVSAVTLNILSIFLAAHGFKQLCNAKKESSGNLSKSNNFWDLQICLPLGEEIKLIIRPPTGLLITYLTNKVAIK